MAANIFSSLFLSNQSVVFSSSLGLFISFGSSEFFISFGSSEVFISFGSSGIFIFIDSLFSFFNSLMSSCISGIRIKSFSSQITS